MRYRGVLDGAGRLLVTPVSSRPARFCAAADPHGGHGARRFRARSGTGCGSPGARPTWRPAREIPSVSPTLLHASSQADKTRSWPTRTALPAGQPGADLCWLAARPGGRVPPLSLRDTVLPRADRFTENSEPCHTAACMQIRRLPGSGATVHATTAARLPAPPRCCLRSAMVLQDGDGSPAVPGHTALLRPSRRGQAVSG